VSNILIFGNLKHILKIMKNLFLFNLTFSIYTYSFFSNKATEKIRDAFEQLVPQAIEVKWTAEGSERMKDWRANYTVGTDSMETKYDSKANWMFTLKYISLNQLPQEVSATIMDNYQGAKLTKAAEMQEPDFDGYGVAFIYLKDRWAVAITKEGKVIRRRITSSGF